MAKSAINNLISIGGEPLGETFVEDAHNFFEEYGFLGEQLQSILGIKNGFYAFESALHFFHFGHSSNAAYDLMKWNEVGLWKKSYGHLLPNSLLCFAEDLFGGQFCIFKNEIFRIDPETADMKFISLNFEDLAEFIMDNFEVETGYPLAHAWQLANHPLQVNDRLLPKIPFVIGGAFNIDNLFTIDAARGMSLRGEIAQKISDLPDGTEVEIRYV